MQKHRKRAVGYRRIRRTPLRSRRRGPTAAAVETIGGNIIMRKQRLRRLEALVEQLDTADKPRPRRLQTAQDVINLLEEQVEALRAEPWAGVVQKARAIGYLAGLARKAIETGTLAARLEMLEAVLRQREGSDQR